jgi:hypothetical protein
MQGNITTIPPRDTLFSPNTSSLQIPIQNLHSFRTYTADENFRVKCHYAKSQRWQCHDSTNWHTFVPLYIIPANNPNPIRAVGNFKVKRQMSLRHDSTMQHTFIPEYIIPVNTNLRSTFVHRRYREEGNFRFKVTVPRSNVPIPPRHTPLSTNTSSSLQIPIQNLHSFRKYRVEGNFRFKVTVPRSKVTLPQFHHVTHICPLIHHPC